MRKLLAAKRLWIADSSVIHALHGAPEWFTSWITLALLAALTVLEWVSVKHSDVRAFMHERPTLEAVFLHLTGRKLRE